MEELLKSKLEEVKKVASRYPNYWFSCIGAQVIEKNPVQIEYYIQLHFGCFKEPDSYTIYASKFNHIIPEVEEFLKNKFQPA